MCGGKIASIHLASFTSDGNIGKPINDYQLASDNPAIEAVSYFPPNAGDDNRLRAKSILQKMTYLRPVSSIQTKLV